MPIYTIANTKGGVGKSTMAIHLAVHLSKTKKALLIDGDIQASSATWGSWRREKESQGLSHTPTMVRLKGKEILTEGKELSKDYENIIIDVGGRDGQDIRNSLILTDFVIIPVGASGLDAAALDDLIPVLEAAKVFNEKLEAFYLFNKIDTRTKDIKEMQEYLKSTENNSINIKIFNSIIHERVAFKRSITNGLTVEELKTDKVAINEMKMFYKEVGELK